MIQSNRPFEQFFLICSPVILLGRLVEWPAVTLADQAAKMRETLTSLGLIFLVVAGSVKPVKADFMGFDLIPLSGSLLMDIRDFYLTYQKQIMAIKRAALAYYTVRQLDVTELLHELGDLAELELTEAARAYVNREVEGYIMALTWTGEENHTQGSGMAPAEHDGNMERDVRYKITGNDGTQQYMTAGQVWNALFNPYDPAWDPRLTQETMFVLRAHKRWLERELGRYKRAVGTWEKLAAVYDGIELEGIGTASASQAIAWAIESTVKVDKQAAQLKSRIQGSIQKYIDARLAYWKGRIADVQMTLDSYGRALTNMEKDVGHMENRVLNMTEARMRIQSRQLWNNRLPGDGREATGPLRVKSFPMGWRRS